MFCGFGQVTVNLQETVLAGTILMTIY